MSDNESTILPGLDLEWREIADPLEHADCPHSAVTWQWKGPGKTVALINGALHGNCDDCGAQLAALATFNPTTRPSEDQ